MKKYLKTLMETFEVVTGDEGKRLRLASESLDVQMDRWRQQCALDQRNIVVLNYELQTAVDAGPDSLVTLSNTMAILYSNAEDLLLYGAGSGIDPIEQQMYKTILGEVNPTSLAGRVLFLSPSPLMNGLHGAVAELSAYERGDADPGKFGTNIYQTIVADRDLSFAQNPEQIVDAARRSLTRGGYFFILENAYVAPGALRGFSLDGVLGLLEGFTILHQGCMGNACGLAHKMVSCGHWMPERSSLMVRPGAIWPVYVWAVGRL